LQSSKDAQDDVSLNKLAIKTTLAAASLQFQPPIIANVVCLSRARPYWTSYSLRDEVSNSLIQPDWLIENHVLLKDIYNLESRILSLVN
jgi:hypothetical protein